VTLSIPPVLLLEQAYTQRALLPPVGLARETEGETPPGLLLSWEHVSQQGVEDGRRDAAPLTPVLADPGACRFNRATIGGAAPAGAWIGRREPRSAAEWDATIAEGMAAQRTLEVDALIVPGKTLLQTDFPDGLQDALDAARRSHETRPSGDPEWLVRVCIYDIWLTDRSLRRTLLNQLTDLPDELGVALHVEWAKSTYPDNDLLTGLQTIVSVLAGDGRRVLVMESGLVGWLSIAWGAWGFTAGLARASWHRSRETVRRSNPAPRVEWYLEHQLLHHVRRSEHQRIAPSGRYEQCACAFCQQLVPTGEAAWDHKLASQHGLYALSELTDSVAAPTLQERRERVAGKIEEARALSTFLRLTGEARPAHLDAWIGRL
jgi:hypothetical protein